MTSTEIESERMLALALEKRTIISFYSNQCFDLLESTVEKVDADKLKKACRNIKILEQVLKDYKKAIKELDEIERSLKEDEDEDEEYLYTDKIR